MKLRILLWLGLFVSAHASAGVTIHFEGQLEDAGSVGDVTRVACEAAKARAWTCTAITGPDDPLVDGITRDFLAKASGRPASGVVIQPPGMSEPLFLVFDERGRVANFIKTQFAGPEVHIGVVELLDAVKPHFARLDVEDEGRFWETRDRALLEEDMASVRAQIEGIKATRPDVDGPVKTAGGRILDLVAK